GVFLRDEGFTVREAPDGAVALRLIQQLRPLEDHLCSVLLDMRLPEVTGLEVLRALEHQGAQVPVVAISSDRHLLAQATLAGAASTMAKSFDVEELLAVVGRHCGDAHE